MLHDDARGKVFLSMHSNFSLSWRTPADSGSRLAALSALSIIVASMEIDFFSGVFLAKNKWAENGLWRFTVDIHTSHGRVNEPGANDSFPNSNWVSVNQRGKSNPMLMRTFTSFPGLLDSLEAFRVVGWGRESCNPAVSRFYSVLGY